LAVPDESPTSPPRQVGSDLPVDAVIELDVAGLTRADVAAVDVLARLQVAARRRGRRIRLVGSSLELRQLLDCLGLTDALPVGGGSGRRPGRQAEEREEASGVEEEADPDDPTA